MQSWVHCNYIGSWEALKVALAENILEIAMVIQICHEGHHLPVLEILAPQSWILCPLHEAYKTNSKLPHCNREWPPLPVTIRKRSAFQPAVQQTLLTPATIKLEVCFEILRASQRPWQLAFRVTYMYLPMPPWYLYGRLYQSLQTTNTCIQSRLYQ